MDIYKDSIDFKTPLSFSFTCQSQPEDDKSNIERPNAILEKKLYLLIENLELCIKSLDQSNLKDFILLSAYFQNIIYQIDQQININYLLLPIKRTKFHIFTLLALRKNFDEISQYTYFYLFILCLFKDDDISNFLIRYNIIGYCFSALQKKTANDHYLISSISYLLPMLEKECIPNIISEIPFDCIFSNPNISNAIFLRSIFQLYQAITEITQIIPHPKKILLILNFISKLTKIDDITLEYIIDYYIQICKIENLDINTISIFLQKEIALEFIIRSIKKSQLQYKFTLKLFQFCILIYKHIKKIAVKFQNYKSIQLLGYITNIFSTDDKEIQSTLLLIHKMIFEHEYVEDLIIIFKYLQIFIKINPICLNYEEIREISLFLFSAINEGTYETKVAANQALSNIIKFGDMDMCQFLLSNNIYDVFMSGLCIDDAKIDSIVIDNYYYFFDKFHYCDNFKDLIAEFANSEFFEIINEVKERSEQHIACKCEGLEHRIHQIMNDDDYIEF